MMMIDWKSLGFSGDPQKTRVVVAMSGGVDSSTAAALMVEAGFDVVGITLQLYDHGEAVSKKGACCAGQDIYDAKRVAETLKIPHYVLNYQDLFKKAVIEDFANSYADGLTPVPCSRCNQRVKFRDLLSTARDLGAEALVTGHYVRWHQGAQGPELRQALDAKRDQSYFMFTTTPEQLAFLRFPLGSLPKEVTREHARRLGLEIADKADSQDICFVPTGHYTSVVEKLRPGALEPGEIVHVDGTVLGQHTGTINYTIGQRRGLRVSDVSGQPLYVTAIEASKQRVIVGPKSALGVVHMTLHEVNWMGPVRQHGHAHAVRVKIRSTQPTALPAKVILREGSCAEVTLEAPEYGVAPGQSCVFYEGDQVLGGGWISRTAPQSRQTA